MPGQPVSQQDADFYLSVLEENVFYAMTALTGVAPGTAVGTTGAFTLHNPVGSEVNLVILEGFMGYVSGTLGAGVVTWNVNTNDDAAAPTGTDIVEVNALTGEQGSVGRALTTSTLPAAPTPIRPFCSLGASLASTAVQPWQVRDRVDGAIVVAPGCSVTLHATAAGGSTPLVVFGVLWKEENIP